MATQPLFKDLGKRVSDLLTKEFPSDKKEQKVEWKSATASGVKLEFNVRSEDGSAGPKTAGTLKNEYFYKPWNTTFTGEVNTDRETKAEVAIQDKLAKGLKAILTLQGVNKKSGGLDYFATTGLEYKHQYASVALSAEVGRTTDNLLKSSIVVGTQGVAVGISADFVRSDTQTDAKEIKSSVSYASDEFDVVGYGKVTKKGKGKAADSVTELGATYYHKLSSDFAVGTEIKFDVSNQDSEKKPTLGFGTSYRLLPDTLVKARFDTEGKLGVSYAQQLNKNAKLLVSATVDTNDPSSKHGTQFGFNLSLNG